MEPHLAAAHLDLQVHRRRKTFGVRGLDCGVHGSRRISGVAPHEECSIQFQPVRIRLQSHVHAIAFVRVGGRDVSIAGSAELHADLCLVVRKLRR